MSLERRKTVAIVGGGLAGLSAGCALADSGFEVTLFERRPYLGGRASSYEHPGTGEMMDNCQHVLLGCCTNLIAFFRRIQVEDKIQWFRELNFLEPGGRLSVLKPSWLPAPLHSSPSFLRAKFLEYPDKDAIARALLSLTIGVRGDSEENFLSWLERHGQTPRGIERFWKPVLVSALNEDLGRIAVRYAAQVFRESFLKSAGAGKMGIPRVPLSGLYSGAGDYIRARDGQVRLRAAVEGMEDEGRSVTLSLSGERLSFDYAIVAAPFEAAGKILPATSQFQPLKEMLAKLEHSPITGIHLWFDRQITELPHAVLLDRTIQWMFHKSKLQERQGKDKGESYVELVVSSSKSLVSRPRQEIIDMAVAELREFVPASRQAQLTKAAVIKEVFATYSVLPDSDRYRPGNPTPSPRIFLAGDWTASGWPATMEGAVRSGHMAAGALARAAGLEKTFVVPDLPAAGLMRLLN